MKRASMIPGVFGDFQHLKEAGVSKARIFVLRRSWLLCIYTRWILFVLAIQVAREFPNVFT